MRIAVFHELHRGGARRAVNKICKILKKTHVVDFYSVDAKPNIEEKKYFTQVVSYPFCSVKKEERNWRKRVYKDSIELLKLSRMHKKIARDIDRKKYDVVFIHPSSFTQAPFILRYLKTLSVYYCQEPLRMIYDKIVSTQTNMYIYDKFVKIFRKKIDKKNIESANSIICNSLFSKKNIYKAYGLDSTVCYLGVEHTFFTPIKKNKDIDVLFVGSKEFIEGYQTFQETVFYLPNTIKYTFLDSSKKWLSDQILRSYYQRSKIVLCLAYDEPFGLIPLEAGSCGCVVVAVAEGGYTESIRQNKTGFVILRNPQLIAKKIQSILNNKQILNKVPKNARREIENKWTWEKSASNIERILKRKVLSS